MPLLLQRPTGSVEIIAAGLDGKLYSTIPDGTWTALAALPAGQTLLGHLTMTQDASGTVNVFALIASGQVQQFTRTSVDRTWKTSTLPHLPRGLSIFGSLVAQQTSAIQLFAQASSGTLYSSQQLCTAHGCHFSAWTSLVEHAPTLVGTPALALLNTGAPTLFALSDTFQILQTSASKPTPTPKVVGTGKAPWKTLVPLSGQSLTPVDGLGYRSFYTYYTQQINQRTQLQVNVGSGNLVVNSGDISIHGTGIDLEIDSHYNSLENRWSPHGSKWLFNVGYDVALHQNDDGSVTYYDPTGNTWTFANNGSGWTTPNGLDADLVHQSDGTNTLTFHKTGEVYTFNTQGVIAKDADKNGNAVTFTYNTSTQLTSVVDSQGRTVTVSYTSGLISKISDPTGRSVSYGYDGNNELTSITDLNGKVTKYGYTNGLLTSITDPLNHTTQIQYNGNNLVAQITDATNAQTSFGYYASGASQCQGVSNACSVVTDRNTHPTTYWYNADFSVTNVKDANGNAVSTKYTPDYNVNQYTDALLDQSVFAYDTNNNLTSVTDGSGAITQFGYPSSGSGLYDPLYVKDPRGNQTDFTYDGNRNLTSATDDATSKGTHYTYNSNGTVATMTDGNNNKTSYSYDSKGNLSKITFPSPLTAQSLSVDSLSRVNSLTDGNNHKTTFTYDNLDRATKISYADGSSISYSYDDNGNVLTETDATGTTSFQYDNDNRITQKKLPSGTTISTGYDKVGNLTSINDGGGTVTYSYDPANRMTTLSEPDGSKTSYGYDNGGHKTSIAYPNGTGMLMTYDKAGRQLTSISGQMNGQGQITTQYSNFSYSYTWGSTQGDQVHNIASLDTINHTDTYNQGLTYDSQKRLVDDMYDKTTGGTVTNVEEYQYQYDAVGNLTSRNLVRAGKQSSLSYNGANELTSQQVTQGGNTTTTSYSYDGNGNLTGNSAGLSLSYNDQNQTVKANSNSYGYSGPSSAERVKVNGNSAVYTGLGLSNETTSSGTTYYVRCSCGLLNDERTPDGKKYYYLFDGEGSVIGLTDSSGNEVSRYAYDPYGNITNQQEGVSNPWKYAGGYYDSSTGFTKFGIRYDDPTTGRWTQRAPVGGSLTETVKVNPYVYGDDDPLNKVDPTGRSVSGCIASAIVDGSFVTGAFGVIVKYGVAMITSIVDKIPEEGLLIEDAIGPGASLLGVYLGIALAAIVILTIFYLAIADECGLPTPF